MYLDLGESAMETETEDDDEVEKLEEKKFKKNELKQKIHDNGSSSETTGDGDGTRANGVFITCIPGYSATTNVKNTDGRFKVIDSFIPQTPVPVSDSLQVPQGFGYGGTVPEKK